MEQKWWKEAVVYQIYPRSFCDSNGDGIGDLPGITSKLDYIKELGVSVIWLCPVYKSPNDDNGYDIADYYDIMDEFGTLEDFNTLLSEAHKRGLRLIMDLVVNHTSDENKWFVESRSSKDNDKRDYYIWRKGKDGKEPNDWTSFFTPSAWQYDEKTGEYYLHLFSKKQPDLNWENEKVRNEVYRLMTWWFDRGIDGFRMDVINCISKVAGLPSVEPNKPGYHWAGKYFISGPRVHEFLHEMNTKVLSKYDCMTVGEAASTTLDEAVRFTEPERKELNMVFQFDLMNMDGGPDGKWQIKKFSPSEFKRITSKWQLGMQGRGWNSVFLGNHDNPRVVSRFGNDGKYRYESAKMFATVLLTLQGTPYIYQGDEIGMTNMPFNSIEDYRDVETFSFYNEAVKKGADKQELMKVIRVKSRDNSRTPIQWSSEKNAGFTTGTPWIQVNPNYTSINVEQSRKDSDSIFHYYQKLIELRKNNPVLVYGDFVPVKQEDENVFAYLRVLGNERMLVVLNLSAENASFSASDDICISESSVAASNYSQAGKADNKLLLRPYEAIVFSL